MALTIAVEDERGKQESKIFDTLGLFIKLIERSDLGKASICMRFIDPYADTVFNSLQMVPFIKELNILATIAESQEEKDLIHKITELATMARDEVHSYLKFYGD